MGTGPNCPKCNEPMVLRTARQGSNAGNQFWGCSAFPKCRGIVAIEGDVADDPVNVAPRDETKPAVEWRENFSRRGWIAQYEVVSSLPSYLLKLDGIRSREIQRLLSQTVFYKNTDRNTEEVADQWVFLAQTLKKILQRKSPLPTVSRRTLRWESGLAENISASADDSDLSHEPLYV